MGQIKVKAEEVLNARPEDVYATIADYRKGHPSILPKESLYDLQVEEGAIWRRYYYSLQIAHYGNRAIFLPKGE